MEVCPLARGVMLPAGSPGWRNPYPPDYGTAFASSILLYPPPPRRPLRSAVPIARGEGEDDGLTTFRVRTRMG